MIRISRAPASSLCGDPSGNRSSPHAIDRRRHRRTAIERIATGICSRGFPLWCRRTFHTCFCNWRRRHHRRSLAWSRRALRDAGLTSIAIGSSLVAALAAIGVSSTASMCARGSGHRRLWFWRIQRRDRDPDPYSTGGRSQDARACHGSLWPYLAACARLGALAAGLASAHFGLQWAVFFGAVFVIAACIWTYRNREQIIAALPIQETDAGRVMRFRKQRAGQQKRS